MVEDQYGEDASGNLGTPYHLEPVQRQLQPHLKKQEQDSQLAELLDVLNVAEQPAEHEWQR